MTSVPLSLDGVSHSVLEGQSEKLTLAPLSRSFEPGRLHVIGGPSGSGKTTLLSILSLSIRATRGMILWGSQNLTGLRPAAQAKWRRDHLGLVFQTSRLVGVMNAREHIRLAAAIRAMPEAEREGVSILCTLGMESKLTHTPDKLLVGKNNAWHWRRRCVVGRQSFSLTNRRRRLTRPMPNSSHTHCGPMRASNRPWWSVCRTTAL